jgi:hypothetical protein
MRSYLLLALLVAVVGWTTLRFRSTWYFFPDFAIGQAIDSLDGVYVYYNGETGNVRGRNRAPDGYNLGLQYQCVEFVKRYYYERFRHKMPEAAGHARDFFDPRVKDGAINPARNLRQYRNGGRQKPRAGDLLVFGPTAKNPYGHVAIVSKADGDEVELVQQNGGAWVRPRQRLDLEKTGSGWRINEKNLLGWLRKTN